MKIILNLEYAAQNGQGEIHHGKLVPCFENSSRIDKIIETFNQKGWRNFDEPKDIGLAPLLMIHEPDYVNFLQTIWNDWQAEGNVDDILPYIWPVPGLPQNKQHNSLNAKIGSFAFSSDTPIMKGTWTCAYMGAQSALTATSMILEGDRSAFSLSRPPGHHAHAGYYGGYCFLNNIAIAAQFALDNGANKVAILDIDYHHGNGTQDIFYNRSDVFTVSIHGDPASNFPYFLGAADETGEDAGEGNNLNIPLPDGTQFDAWHQALESACARIKAYNADYLFVALGVDTFEGDPISKFKLKTNDYLQIGKTIESIGLPTVFILEGGYSVGPIGDNIYNVLSGFENLKKW